MVLLEDVSKTLVHSTEKGRQQIKAFVRQHINSYAIGFWEPIPNMKIKMFSSTNKIHIKASNRLVTVNANRDLFGRLLIVLNT